MVLEIKALHFNAILPTIQLGKLIFFSKWNSGRSWLDHLSFFLENKQTSLQYIIKSRFTLLF